MFQTKGYREAKRAFYIQNFFSFRKPFPLWDIVEKNGRAGQTTDDNMTHGNYILGI